MIAGIDRRRCLTLLAVGSTTWPAPVRAQLAKQVIGYLMSGAADDGTGSSAGLRQGLREAGYIEGHNLEIDARWADGQYDRLGPLVAELLARRASVIVCGALPATVAAKQATTTTPIVFVMGADPVKQGIVDSLARPGGNVTGVTQLYGAVGGKRLELLNELVPAVATVAVLSNPRNPNFQNHLTEVEAAARAMRKHVTVVKASTPEEIDAAFASMARLGAGALLVADDPLLRARREQVATLAARHRLPAVHFGRDFVVSGGLLSFGSSARENMRLAGGYVARILNGTKPSDLPVLQPTEFELAINLRAARMLGIEVPQALLDRADEVIE